MHETVSVNYGAGRQLATTSYDGSTPARLATELLQEIVERKNKTAAEKIMDLIRRIEILTNVIRNRRHNKT